MAQMLDKECGYSKGGSLLRVDIDNKKGIGVVDMVSMGRMRGSGNVNRIDGIGLVAMDCGRIGR